MILAAAERKLGVAEKLPAVICDPRDPLRVVHLLVDILRARIFAIACGYEDADNLDWLRSDPAFMTTRAVGALSNQSDQPSARSQSLIKPRCKRPSRNACLPQINRQNLLLGE